MPDEDLLLDIPHPEFGAGVVGVCDICHSRQAVIVLNKERFKLCVLDYLNKGWIRSDEKPAATTLPFVSTSEFVDSPAAPGGVAVSIHLKSLKTVKHPLVTIVPDVLGITAEVLEAAIRFARAGYDAVIPDLGRVPGVGLFDYGFQRGMHLVTGSVPVNTSRRARLFRVVDVCRVKALEDPMVDPKRQAVFGIGYGGALALAYAAETPDISGVALAYPRAVTPGAVLRAISCPVLAVYGEEDERSGHGFGRLKADAEAAGMDLHVSVIDGTAHAFFDRANRDFSVPAAEAGWSEILTFLKARLEPPPTVLKPTPPPVTKPSPPPKPAAAPAPPAPAAPSGSAPSPA